MANFQALFGETATQNGNTNTQNYTTNQQGLFDTSLPMDLDFKKLIEQKEIV